MGPSWGQVLGAKLEQSWAKLGPSCLQNAFQEGIQSNLVQKLTRCPNIHTKFDNFGLILMAPDVRKLYKNRRFFCIFCTSGRKATLAKKSCPSSPSWHDFAPKLGHVEGKMGTSWAKLGQCGAKLGPSWGQVGASWANLEPSWGQVGAKLGQVGPTWSQVGSKLGQSWPKLV